MQHKICNAMGARDADYQLAGLIQVDDAFFNGGASKGGDKRGRGTRKVPVLVMAATHNDAITFAKMEILDQVDGEHVQSVLARHVSPKQSIKSDGLHVFTVVKGMGHTHCPEVVYPKRGTCPGSDLDSITQVQTASPNDNKIGCHYTKLDGTS
jgi:hypothetical protein